VLHEGGFREEREGLFWIIAIKINPNEDGSNRKVSLRKKGNRKVADAMRSVEKIDIKIGDSEISTSAEEARNRLEEHLKKDKYSARIEAAEKGLRLAEERQVEVLNLLAQELEKPSAELLSALNAWGRSRNALGETGSEQKGFNAGVVHYFEYRTHPRKNIRRFRPADTLNAEGFIAFTKRYEDLINNPNPETNSKIIKARLLEDPKGNRRLYIFTKEKDFVVSFQRTGEKMKLLSVYMGQDVEMLNRTAEEELKSTPQATARFNRLEPPVKEIPLK